MSLWCSFLTIKLCPLKQIRCPPSAQFKRRTIRYAYLISYKPVTLKLDLYHSQHIPSHSLLVSITLISTHWTNNGCWVMLLALYVAFECIFNLQGICKCYSAYAYHLNILGRDLILAVKKVFFCFFWGGGTSQKCAMQSFHPSQWRHLQKLHVRKYNGCDL